MPAVTDLYTQAAPPAPAGAPPARTGDTMTTLYTAALGPVNLAHYLDLFARFDASGRASAGWNWAASLSTINWMVFRHLWTAALAYVAAAEGLGLLLLGLGRQYLQWPLGVEWGVMGALALLAFAVPGLFGDAILHADVRRRITRALSSARTVPEACAALSTRASSRKRLQVLVLVNIVLAVGLIAAFLMLPRSGLPNAALEPAVTVAQAASAAAESATLPAPTAPNAPPAPAVPAAPLQDAEARPEPNAAAVAPLEAASAAALPEEPMTATASVEPPAPAPAPAPVPASAPAPATKALKPAARSTKTAEKPRAAAAKRSAASATAMASDSVPAPVGSKPGYYINVGLFAEEANARKAQARLLNEGFPAFRQEIEGKKGRRIRVRAGPYGSRAEADQAAAAIRAMALEAVVFKQ